MEFSYCCTPKVSLRGRGKKKKMEFCEFQKVFLKNKKIKFWVKRLGEKADIFPYHWTTTKAEASALGLFFFVCRSSSFIFVLMFSLFLVPVSWFYFFSNCEMGFNVRWLVFFRIKKYCCLLFSSFQKLRWVACIVQCFIFFC